MTSPEVTPIVLAARSVKDWEEFVEFWQFCYEEGRVSDIQYLESLRWQGGELTAADIRTLFEWKTSGRKLPQWSPEPIVAELRRLNRLRFSARRGELSQIAEKLAPGGLVKRFFICHIFSPLEYPIWDQRVLTAFAVLTDRVKTKNELKEYTDENICEPSVYDEYATFFIDTTHSLRAKNGLPPFRRLDRALWGMGTCGALPIVGKAGGM